MASQGKFECQKEFSVIQRALQESAKEMPLANHAAGLVGIE
jgi:hypothetical protein